MAEQKDYLENFSKYEKARILGARSLQIAMNAPLLVEISPEDLEKIKFDAIKIAEIELESGALPISVNKPFPLKRESQLKREKDKLKTTDKDIEEQEAQEEEEIAREGEIMELAKTEDDDDFEEDSSEED
jgi:DNA-directed RNA polymerase subunit K